MEKIAKCESGGTHYRQDGRLVKNVNKNGTMEFGNFQINQLAKPKVASIVYNINLPEENDVFAYRLYDTSGTGDCHSSKNVGLYNAIHNRVAHRRQAVCR